jgi:hypothetical protein
MAALLRVVLPALLLAGCLNGDFNAPDQGAPVPDLSASRMFDLAGLDLFGAYNCSALNACERACTTKACVFMCRNMATPSAAALEMDLQACFVTNCPTGTGQVCAPDAMGMLSMPCTICINNTYIPNGTDCSPTQNPSECHQCLTQANACSADM